ncbi:MAG: type IV secretory system conjugative DNA transfer family protein [Acidimicrobiia bacterium]
MNERHQATNVALGVLAAVFAISAAVWAGAQLAARLFGAGAWLDADLNSAAHALTRLGQHLGDPRRAWPTRVRDDLPGEAPYWACTLVVFAGVAGTVIPAASLLLRPAVGSPRRRRLGVDAQARFATTRDLAPLIIPGPCPARLVLGRVGRHLVATEARERPPSRSANKARRGDRSSVLVIGPTRCGKTANAIAGALDWSGPAILSSVKADLMGATLARRRDLGEVRVFDPTRSTDEATAGWSPLRAAATLTGAQKAARALADAGPQRGADNLDFFLRLAEQLLWPLLWIAAVSECTMRDVVRWTMVQDRPTATSPGEVAPLVDAHLYSPDEQRQEDAAFVLDAIRAAWVLDDRTRSNVYATVQTLIGPWSDPVVAKSAESHDIDLDWLLAGTNTLYLCAPQHEQARLAPVFGGLVGDLIQQAFERAGRDNRPLPPTLVILDEAGNTPTRWLPGVASTCAGIGLLLVTIWQSKAQIDAAYGRLADSVLTNHGTKIVFSGVSDPATLEYAAKLLGDEEILRRSTSLDLTGGRRTLSEGLYTTRLVPAHVLRQVRPGEALLLHGTLPPAHLHARPYYRDRRLRALAAGKPAPARTTARSQR